MRRRNSIPISETPLGVLIMAGFILMISIYSFCVLIKEFRPKVFGKKIEAKVHSIDSVYSGLYHNRKQYNYKAILEFKYENTLLYKKYSLVSSKKKGAILDLYYSPDYGFYDPYIKEILYVFLTISVISTLLLLFFFYEYFKTR